jgi:chemotaxis signal transduction protein
MPVPDLQLGGEMFAVGILSIKEIIEYGRSPRCR